MLELVLVFIGGSVGSALRYLLSRVASTFGNAYNGTFIINMIGCLFFGFVTYIAIKKGNIISSRLKLFLTTGVAGGFTTFSTFSYESFNLIKSGNIEMSFIYMTSSLLVGLFAISLGMYIAKYSLSLSFKNIHGENVENSRFAAETIIEDDKSEDEAEETQNKDTEYV